MENIVPINNAGGKNPASLLAGILVGGLTAFGIVLLLAPSSGRRTRARISQKSAALRGRAAGTFNDLLRLSHFDHRKIQARTREEAERVRDHAALSLRSRAQEPGGPLPANDGLGG